MEVSYLLCYDIYIYIFTQKKARKEGRGVEERSGRVEGGLGRVGGGFIGGGLAEGWSFISAPFGGKYLNKFLIQVSRKSIT